MPTAPTGSPRRWSEAEATLAAADPALAAVMAWAGPCRLGPGRVAGGAFGALARAVCYQQLAGQAAAAIHGRFVAVYGGRPTAGAVAATDDAVLRSVGLSSAKVASIKDLAAKVGDGTVRLGQWHRQGDDEVVERLIAVRGIGPWTAHMFLMFHLGRPDVWPTGDFGVRAGYASMHALAQAPSARELAPLGELYRPWRSVAAWYCWRAVDGLAPDW